MSDITFYERRSFRIGGRDWAIVAIVVLIGWLASIVPHGDYDRDPGCGSQDGDPGLVQMAKPVTSDMPIICDTIMHDEFRVIPPR